MKVTVDDVKYIAKLTKLDFSEEEAEDLAKEFESILEHFKAIDKLDLSDIQVDIFSEDLKPVLRKDVSTVFEDKKKLFQNVKSMRDTAIIVPKIID